MPQKLSPHPRKRGTDQKLQDVIWEFLAPRIEVAEQTNDLTALRALTTEIHEAIASLNVQGTYYLEDAELRVLTETGQELDPFQKERLEDAQEVAYARALDYDDVSNMADRARNAVRNWLTVHEAPEAIAKLVDDYAYLYHGSVALWLNYELEHMSAWSLTESYRDATLQIHELRTAKLCKVQKA